MPAARLAAAGRSSGSYRVLETLASRSFAIGFRSDDYVRYYVEAALQELAADGTVTASRYKWFSEDNTSFPRAHGALEPVSGIPPRTLLVGVDADAYPHELSG